jgi:hypothetical protein
MDVLGHSQIAVTMNIYGHVIPAMQQSAAYEIDAALEDPVRSRTWGSGGHEGEYAARLLSALLSTVLEAVQGMMPCWLHALLTSGAPPGTRTPNPRIKSPLLCQLS